MTTAWLPPRTCPARISGPAERLRQFRVEAQIHGPVGLDRDVEALVLDPSYRGTDVEDPARRLPCPVEWHGGFRLTVQHLRRHPDYRGQEHVDLGAEIAVDGYLDPRIIGEAARSGRYEQQALKKVWHCLARFGSPRDADTGVISVCCPSG